ncbi:Electron transport complex protein RnfE [hydrothermal vent metagenome]|uniref:Electron transport complex protein RnfE n=1 Tax=hydrothermal vent metagenome TaxID=652676 RepID=A0A3B0V8F7_9ZZZZ
MSSFIRSRLIDNNAALVQLLGLCPLLAVSNTAINALGLGIATVFTLTMTNALISIIKPIISKEIRISIFVLVIASVVTALEMFMNAYFHELYLILGIFIPLIVTNCIIMARAESFASKNALWISVKDGFFTGLGFALVLFTIGVIREIIGQGSIFSQAHLLFGDFGSLLNWQIFKDYQGFLIAILPPGAFFVLAVLVAIKNRLSQQG